VEVNRVRSPPRTTPLTRAFALTDSDLFELLAPLGAGEMTDTIRPSLHTGHAGYGSSLSSAASTIGTRHAASSGSRAASVRRRICSTIVPR
jgi:hypothetical protein